MPQQAWFMKAGYRRGQMWSLQGTREYVPTPDTSHHQCSKAKRKRTFFVSVLIVIRVHHCPGCWTEGLLVPSCTSNIFLFKNVSFYRRRVQSQYSMTIANLWLKKNLPQRRGSKEKDTTSEMKWDVYENRNSSFIRTYFYYRWGVGPALRVSTHCFYLEWWILRLWHHPLSQSSEDQQINRWRE